MKGISSENRIEVTIPCGTITLEGILEYPNQTENLLPAAVICHPHPLYGGNMHNNVVRALKRGLLDKNFVVLRFNFRGVEGSWGKHGNGIDEIQDVLSAIDFLESSRGIRRDQILVAGYSFGCWVGLKAASSDKRANLLVGISPPADMYDFSFLESELRPKMLVVGDRDFVCSVPNFNKLVDQLPDPKMTKILANTDHLHFGKEQALVKELNAFLDAYASTRSI